MSLYDHLTLALALAPKFPDANWALKRQDVGCVQDDFPESVVIIRCVFHDTEASD